MADKKIEPTNPTTPTPPAQAPAEDKTVERKTSTRSRRLSGRKANSFRGA